MTGISSNIYTMIGCDDLNYLEVEGNSHVLDIRARLAAKVKYSPLTITPLGLWRCFGHAAKLISVVSIPGYMYPRSTCRVDSCIVYIFNASIVGSQNSSQSIPPKS